MQILGKACVWSRINKGNRLRLLVARPILSCYMHITSSCTDLNVLVSVITGTFGKWGKTRNKVPSLGE